jgi:hypothetical protein
MFSLIEAVMQLTNLSKLPNSGGDREGGERDSERDSERGLSERGASDKDSVEDSEKGSVKGSKVYVTGSEISTESGDRDSERLRQVKGVRNALVYGNGGIFSASAVAILGRGIEPIS